MNSCLTKIKLNINGCDNGNIETLLNILLNANKLFSNMLDCNKEFEVRLLNLLNQIDMEELVNDNISDTLISTYNCLLRDYLNKLQIYKNIQINVDNNNIIKIIQDWTPDNKVNKLQLVQKLGLMNRINQQICSIDNMLIPYFGTCDGFTQYFIKIGCDQILLCSAVNKEFIYNAIYTNSTTYKKYFVNIPTDLSQLIPSIKYINNTNSFINIEDTQLDSSQFILDTLDSSGNNIKIPSALFTFFPSTLTDFIISDNIFGISQESYSPNITTKISYIAFYKGNYVLVYKTLDFGITYTLEQSFLIILSTSGNELRTSLKYSIDSLFLSYVSNDTLVIKKRDGVGIWSDISPTSVPTGTIKNGYYSKMQILNLNTIYIIHIADILTNDYIILTKSTDFGITWNHYFVNNAGTNIIDASYLDITIFDNTPFISYYLGINLIVSRLNSIGKIYHNFILSDSDTPTVYHSLSSNKTKLFLVYQNTLNELKLASIDKIGTIAYSIIVTLGESGNTYPLININNDFIHVSYTEVTSGEVKLARSCFNPNGIYWSILDVVTTNSATSNHFIWYNNKTKIVVGQINDNNLIINSVNSDNTKLNLNETFGTYKVTILLNDTLPLINFSNPIPTSLQGKEIFLTFGITGDGIYPTFTNVRVDGIPTINNLSSLPQNILNSNGIVLAPNANTVDDFKNLLSLKIISALHIFNSQLNKNIKSTKSCSEFLKLRYCITNSDIDCEDMPIYDINC
jgi:hypothetical protein